MCQVHWLEKILVLFFSLCIFLIWWLILLPWLPVQMPRDKGMGMSLWSLEGKRRSRIDVQGRTSLSTSHDLLEKPFYRAFVEVERVSGESLLLWLLWETSVNQTDGGQGLWYLVEHFLEEATVSDVSASSGWLSDLKIKPNTFWPFGVTLQNTTKEAAILDLTTDHSGRITAWRGKGRNLRGQCGWPVGIIFNKHFRTFLDWEPSRATIQSGKHSFSLIIILR